MEDMLRYLDHIHQTPPEGQLLLVATRHEDGAWVGPESLAYHRQRAQLFHELGEVDGVQVTDWFETDAEDPRETARMLLELAPTVIPAVATIVAAWIAVLPLRKQKAEPGNATVPGLVWKKPDGSRLEISHRIPPEERAELIEQFLRHGDLAQPQRSRPQTAPP